MNPFDPYQTGLVVRWLKPSFPEVDEYMLSLAVIKVTRQENAPTLREELLIEVRQAIKKFGEKASA